MKISIKNNTSALHRSTIENGLIRSMMFLRTVGTDPAIRAAMEKTGFSLADLKQGWALMLKACMAPVQPTQFQASAGPVADATQKIEQWQSAMFLRSHAALRRLHPEQDSFVFENLTTGSGIAAVLAVSMFLSRLDALESSPERKSSRKADHAALATLEQRGVTKAERKEIKQLVQLVETTAAPAPESEPVADERTAALTELYAWVQDWSDCARTVVTRRDQLLRLGIGKRRVRSSKSVDQPAPVAPSPVPIVADITQAAVASLPPAKPNGVAPGSLALPAHA